MRTISTHPATSRGFTLLELLIGLSLLGFILALLFGGFRLASTTGDAVEGKLSELAYEQGGLGLIRRLFDSAQPIYWTQAQRRILLFHGEQDVVTFAAPLTELSGLRIVQLALEPDSGMKNSPHNRLVLRYGAIPYGAPTFDGTLAASSIHTVLGDIRSATFEFLGSIAPDKPVEWQSQWLKQSKLPLLIRIRVLRSDAEQLDITIAPAVKAEDVTGIRITAGPQL